ncbi:MAG: hypothetical protein QME52_10145, partial [Bacteroidota bacterium]|nr:hypothetical protein [Bacteroidota bacterium]
GDRKPFVFLQTEFDEDAPMFSPDMRWISYVSNESGKMELYVRPFIGADGQPVINQIGKWQVSTNGISLAFFNKWNRNGKSSRGGPASGWEIFYMSTDNKLMAAEVKAIGSTFDVGLVRPLFEMKVKGQVYFSDVTADGQKFLMVVQVGGQSVPPLTLVTNWDAGLKKK